MDSSTLAALLIKDISGYSNPYLQAAQTVAAQEPYPYKMSMGEALASGAIQGLMTGGLTAYGKHRAEEDYYKPLADALAKPTYEEQVAALQGNPELQDFANTYQLYGQFQKQEQEQRKQEEEADMARELMKTQLGLQADIEKARALGPINAENAYNQAKMLQPLELEKSRAQAAISASNRESYQDAINERYNARMLAGEQANAQQFDKSKEIIGNAYDTTKGVHSFNAMMPYTDAAAQFDSARAAIVSSLQASWKGPMSDQDMKRIEPLLPTKLDDQSRIEIKKNQMLELLRNNAKPTPILSGRAQLAGDAAPPRQDAFTPSAAPQSAGQTVPPGMKLQRNKVTGETRLVPQ